MQPLSSQLRCRNAGRERGRPSRRPTAGTDKAAFLLPPPPAERAACSRRGKRWRQQMPRGRAQLPPNSPQSSCTPCCLLSPGLLEDKSPFLHLSQPKASPGRISSPTDAGALLMQRRLHTDVLSHHAPREPLHPTAHRLQSACLPAPNPQGRGALEVHSCLTCCCPLRPKLGTAHPDSPHIRYQQSPELHCAPLARIWPGHGHAAHAHEGAQTGRPCHAASAMLG